MTEGFFVGAPYRCLADPLVRLLGYVDFRIGIPRGELPDYRCFLGTLLQETYATHPDIRAACERGLVTDNDTSPAMSKPPSGAESVSVFIQSALQGALSFAEAPL
jgi:TetR/AcrR family transcriptional regulator, transcriptional repressor for nem operon